MKRVKRKYRFANIQQFAKHLTDTDDTEQEGDEINITQAMTIAKTIIKLVASLGGQDGVANLKKKLHTWNPPTHTDRIIIGKTSITSGQFDRLLETLDELFEYEWKLFWPWSKSRKNTKNLKYLAKIYGYFDMK